MGWFYTVGRVVGIIFTWDINNKLLIKCVHKFLDRRAQRLLGAWRTPSGLVNLTTFETSSEVETELADVFGNRFVCIHKTFHTNGNWDPVSVKDTETSIMHINRTAVLLKREGTILCIGTNFSVFFQSGFCRGLMRP